MELHPSERFEIHGYFVEYMDAETSKCYGFTLMDEQGDWKLGYWGRRYETLTAPIQLTKGIKPYFLNASPARPIKVFKMCQAICGRLLKPVHTTGQYAS